MENQMLKTLLQALSSEDFHAREAAEETLATMDHVLPHLRAITKFESAEQRRRIRRIIDVQVRAQTSRLVATVVQRKERAELDLLIDALVLNRAVVGDKEWELLTGLITRLFDKNSKVVGAPLPEALKQYAGLTILPPEDLREKRVRGSKRILASRLDISNTLLNSLVVSGGDCVADGIIRSVVLANGSINLRDGRPGSEISEALVFCTGDVRCELINKSIVVATGRILCHVSTGNCLFENITPESGPVGLFGLKSIGLGLRVQGGTVVVEKVQPGAPLEGAGLRKGDEILTVNGREFRDIRKLTDFVRSARVCHEELTLIIQRPGDGRLSIRVDDPLWQ
jgi:hypothetical protein